VEKKAKETGESAADIRKKIKCHNNCGKSGHISTTARKRRQGSLRKASRRTRARKSVRYSQLSKSVMRSTA
jgi:hypothetical protein